MFFFRKGEGGSEKGKNDSPEKNDNPEPPAEPDTSGGFFSLNNADSSNISASSQAPQVPQDSMFGGMDVKVESDPVGEAPPSSFAFMQESIGEEQEPTGGSSFSFLNSNSNSDVGASTAGSSSFSFLNSNSDTRQVENTESTASSFSFLSGGGSEQSESSPPLPQIVEQSIKNDLLSAAPQEIKLTRVASTAKVVRKKKRTSKVGSGRDEAEDDNRIAHSPSTPTNPPSQLGAIQETEIEEESSPRYPAPTTHQPQKIQEQAQESTSRTPPVVAITLQDPSEGYVPDFAQSNLPASPPAHPMGFSPNESAPEENTNTREQQEEESEEEEPISTQYTPVELKHPPRHLPPLPSTRVPALPPTLAAPTKVVSLEDICGSSAPSRGDLILPNNDPSNADESVMDQQQQEEEATSANMLIFNSTKFKLKCMQESMQLFSDQQQKAFGRQKAIKQSLATCSSSALHIKASINTAEAEQMKLAALEDFEKADALNDVMDAHKASLNDLNAKTEDLKAAATDIVRTFRSDQKTSISNITKHSTELVEETAKLQVELHKLDVELADKVENEQQRLRGEEDRLSLERSHFEREEESLDSELRSTEEAISSQISGELEGKRYEIETGVHALQAEIRQLEDQLKVKRAEETKLLKDLAVVDSRIGDVRKKYDRQLQRLQDRRTALDVTKAECMQEMDTIAQERTKFERETGHDRAQHESLLDWCTLTARVVGVAEAFVQSVSPSDAKHSLLQLVSSMTSTQEDDDDDNNSNSYAQLQGAVDDADVALATAQSSEAELKAHLDELTADIKGVADQLPSLELDKKAHAASKRFKEAAGVAKDIKELLTKKDSLERAVENVMRELAATAEAITRCETACSTTGEQLREAQRDQDKERFDTLKARAKVIRRNKAKIRKLGQGQGQEGGYNNFIAASIEFFETEQRAVDEELRAIQQVYDTLRDVCINGDDDSDGEVDGKDGNGNGNGNVDDDDDDYGNVDDGHDDDDGNVDDDGNGNGNGNGNVDDDDGNVDDDGNGNGNVDDGAGGGEDKAVSGGFGFLAVGGDTAPIVASPSEEEGEGEGTTGVSDGSRAGETVDGSEVIVGGNSLVGVDQDTEEEEAEKEKERESEREREREREIERVRQEEERRERMKIAKSALGEIDDLNEAMSDAAESEDYELAESIMEEVTSKRGELDTLLGELECEEEEVLGFECS